MRGINSYPTHLHVTVIIGEYQKCCDRTVTNGHWVCHSHLLISLDMYLGYIMQNIFEISYPNISLQKIHSCDYDQVSDVNVRCSIVAFT